VRVGGWSEDELESRSEALAALVRRAWRAVSRTVSAVLGSTKVITQADADEVTRRWNEQLVSHVLPYVGTTFLDAAKNIYTPVSTFGAGVPEVDHGDDLFRTHMKVVGNRLVGVGDDVWALVRDQIIEGNAAGEGPREIAARIAAVAGVSDARALTIARTEVHAAHEAGSLAQALLVDPGATKEWLATRDDRTRETHRAAGGQVVKIGEPFRVGSTYLMVPGDVNGPADEVINCRCTVAFDFSPDEVTSPPRRELQLTAGDDPAAVPDLTQTVRSGGRITPVSDESDDVTGADDLTAGVWKKEVHPRGKDGKFIEKSNPLLELLVGAPSLETAVASIHETSRTDWEKLTPEQKAKVYDLAVTAYGEQVPGGGDVADKLHAWSVASTPLSAVGDFSTLKKISGQQGSNPGGMFASPSGDRFYVKKAKTPAHAANEVAAAALYNLAGVTTPQVHRGVGAPDIGGGLQTRTKIIDGKGTIGSIGLSSGVRDKIRDGFAVDAWLANWDVAGLVNDNVIVDAHGDPVRIDVGGALLYRAQGAPKGTAWGAVPNEITTLRDPQMNPQSAKIFGGMTDAEIGASAQKHLAHITDAQVDDVIKQAGLDPSVATTLKKRRDWLLKTYPAPTADTTPSKTTTQVVATPFTVLPRGERGKSGDGYAAPGLWGKYGAAGVIIQAPGDDGQQRYLFVQRGPIVSSNKGKWQLPGGALDEHETPEQGAAREIYEEVGAPETYLGKMTQVGTHAIEVPIEGKKPWVYSNIAVRAGSTFAPMVDGTETGDAKWLTHAEVMQLHADGQLHPALAKNIDKIFALYDNDKTPDVLTNTSPSVSLLSNLLTGDPDSQVVVDYIHAASQADWDALTPVEKVTVYDLAISADGEMTPGVVTALSKLHSWGATPLHDPDRAPDDTPNLVPVKKVTTALIWGKHADGAVVLQGTSGNGEARLLWDGKQKKYVYQERQSNAYPWKTLDVMTKKSAYENFGSDTGWFTPAPVMGTEAPAAPTTMPQVVAQVGGTPIKINTKTVWGTQYEDGQVVAVRLNSIGSGERLRWDAKIKKFRHQVQSVDGHWLPITQYNKKQTYEKFKDDTNWVTPEPTLTQKLDAAKLTEQSGLSVPSSPPEGPNAPDLVPTPGAESGASWPLSTLDMEPPPTSLLDASTDWHVMLTGLYEEGQHNEAAAKTYADLINLNMTLDDAQAEWPALTHAHLDYLYPKGLITALEYEKWTGHPYGTNPTLSLASPSDWDVIAEHATFGDYPSGHVIAISSDGTSRLVSTKGAVMNLAIQNLIDGDWETVESFATNDDYETSADAGIALWDMMTDWGTGDWVLPNGTNAPPKPDAAPAQPYADESVIENWPGVASGTYAPGDVVALQPVPGNIRVVAGVTPGTFWVQLHHGITSAWQNVEPLSADELAAGDWTESYAETLWTVPPLSKKPKLAPALIDLSTIDTGNLIDKGVDQVVAVSTSGDHRITYVADAVTFRLQYRDPDTGVWGNSAITPFDSLKNMSSKTKSITDAYGPWVAPVVEPPSGAQPPTSARELPGVPDWLIIQGLHTNGMIPGNTVVAVGTLGVGGGGNPVRIRVDSAGLFVYEVRNLDKEQWQVLDSDTGVIPLATKWSHNDWHGVDLSYLKNTTTSPVTPATGTTFDMMKSNAASDLAEYILPVHDGDITVTEALANIKTKSPGYAHLSDLEILQAADALSASQLGLSDADAHYLEDTWKKEQLGKAQPLSLPDGTPNWKNIADAHDELGIGTVVATSPDGEHKIVTTVNGFKMTAMNSYVPGGVSTELVDVHGPGGLAAIAPIYDAGYQWSWQVPAGLGPSVPTPQVATPTGDTSSITDAQKKQLRADFKTFGSTTKSGIGYWSKPEKIWDVVEAVRAKYSDDGNPAHSQYTPLQVLRVLDENLKTKDSNLYEKKITAWLTTPEGTAYVGSKATTTGVVPALSEATEATYGPAGTHFSGFPKTTDAVDLADVTSDVGPNGLPGPAAVWNELQSAGNGDVVAYGVLHNGTKIRIVRKNTTHLGAATAVVEQLSIGGTQWNWMKSYGSASDLIGTTLPVQKWYSAKNAKKLPEPTPADATPTAPWVHPETHLVHTPGTADYWPTGGANVNVPYVLKHHPKVSYADIIESAKTGIPGQIVAYGAESGYGSNWKYRLVVAPDSTPDEPKLQTWYYPPGGPWATYYAGAAKSSITSAEDLKKHFSWNISDGMWVSAKNAKIIKPGKTKSSIGPVMGPVPLPTAGQLNLGGGDTSHLTAAKKLELFKTFRKQSATYSNSPDSDVYAAVKTIADENGLSALQMLRVIDEVYTSEKKKPSNTHVFEKKIIAWLQTPQGHAVATGVPLPKPPTPKFAPGVSADGVPSFAQSSKYSYGVLPTSSTNAWWAKVTAAYGDWTNAQRTALKTYTGGVYYSINAFYYGKIESITSGHENTAKNAQLGMRPSLEPVLLHRGVGFDALGVKNHEQLEKLVGQVRKQEGFGSTSVGGQAAFSSKPMLIEVEAPPGTPMAWLKPISNLPSENEMLLAAGLHYQIISVKKAGYQSVVRVRVVPAP